MMKASSNFLNIVVVMKCRVPYLWGVFLLWINDGQLVVPWSGFQLACAVNGLFVHGALKVSFLPEFFS